MRKLVVKRLRAVARDWTASKHGDAGFVAPSVRPGFVHKTSRYRNILRQIKRAYSRGRLDA